MNYQALENVSDAEFKRACGVPRITFNAMREVWLDAQAKKRKPGRPPKLCAEDQLLLALSYWREYRTLFHVGKSFGLHESNAQRLVTRVEDVLIRSGKFRLPKPTPHEADDLPWEVIVIDATETPCERPKKNSAATTVARKKAIH